MAEYSSERWLEREKAYGLLIQVFEIITSSHYFGQATPLLYATCSFKGVPICDCVRKNQAFGQKMFFEFLRCIAKFTFLISS